MVNPSCSAVQRPVCIRHKSTARRRATATMAFLRTAPNAPEPLANTAGRFCTGGYCGWKRTMRQAHSTKAGTDAGVTTLGDAPWYPFAPAAALPRDTVRQVFVEPTPVLPFPPVRWGRQRVIKEKRAALGSSSAAAPRCKERVPTFQMTRTFQSAASRAPARRG